MAQQPMATYDPSRIVMSVAGIQISGFNESKMVDVEMPDGRFVTYTHCDGGGARVRIASSKIVFTLTLAQSSLSNDVLQGLFIADEISSRSFFPVLIKDLNGATLCFAAEAYITKLPKLGFGKEMGDREWVIEAAVGTIISGGNS